MLRQVIGWPFTFACYIEYSFAASLTATSAYPPLASCYKSNDTALAISITGTVLSFVAWILNIALAAIGGSWIKN